MTAEHGVTTGSSAPPEVDFEQVYARLSSRSIHDVLGIHGSPAPELLLSRLRALREQVTTLARSDDMEDLSAAMLARVAEVERIVLDPLEWYIHAKSAPLRQDPNDPAVRGLLEAQFLEQHLPRALWLMTVTWGAVDARAQHRFPILCSSTVALPGASAAIRCDTENLSRSGVRLIGLPVPGPDKGEVTITLQLPDEPEAVQVAGTIMWRKADRVGIAFQDVSLATATAIDRALQRHFQIVLQLAERYIALAPQDPTAIACVCIARSFASSDDKLRHAQLETVTAAAGAAPKSLELQLAVAKLAFGLGVAERGRHALRRAGELAPHDPRVVELSPAVRRAGESPLAAMWRDARGKLADARVALVVIPLVVVGAAAVAFLAMPKGAQVATLQKANGLPCAQALVGGTKLVCTLGTGVKLPAAASDWEGMAEVTLSEVRGQGVKEVVVLTADGLPIGQYGVPAQAIDLPPIAAPASMPIPAPAPGSG